MRIESKRTVLRAVEPEDKEFLAYLFNESNLSGQDAPREIVYPVSAEMEEAWISSVTGKPDEAHMIIENRKNALSLGIISIDEMNFRNGSARLRIRLTRKNWDDGIGAEAIEAVTDFLFDRMNIRRVWARVDEDNSRAIRCFEKCGFTLEGVLREDHVRDGAWKNSLLMSQLKSDPRRG